MVFKIRRLVDSLATAGKSIDDGVDDLVKKFPNLIAKTDIDGFRTALRKAAKGTELLTDEKTLITKSFKNVDDKQL